MNPKWQITAAMAVTLLLNGCGNTQAVHEAAKDSAASNIAVIGNQPSPALAAECERHVVQNHLGESIRASWRRSTPYDSKYAFLTTQGMTHAGHGDLGKKLVPYYAKFSGTNAFGLPGTITAVCFFRVEGGKARFETSCKTGGGSCPFFYHVPPWDY
jgi:hypothetical protein